MEKLSTYKLLEEYEAIKVIGGNRADKIKTLGKIAGAGIKGAGGGAGIGAIFCGPGCAVVGGVYGAFGGLTTIGFDLAN
ncbi:Blp family class II bacteriocin [Marinilactibacillus kalidii]|uniref:Blp family class II bacteriocin n=1 Tax=Marinilactibacillus kalidii TaxID=2820274 RepID=UPI001ABE80A9|nr:Blp family class II bacteriocin [Marinilactibacillus kalidii]